MTFRSMPFGQYKGWDIAELPDGYLAWLTTIELRGWLYNAVHREYDRRTDRHERREDESEYRTPAPTSAEPGIRIRPEELPLARRLFDAGYRNLARSLHPDLGGDTDDMRRLNLLAESLRTQMAALEAK